MKNKFLFLTFMTLALVFTLSVQLGTQQKAKTVQKLELKLQIPSNQLLSNIQKKLNDLEKHVIEMDEISVKMKRMILNLRMTVASAKPGQLEKNENLQQKNKLMKLNQSIDELQNQMQIECRSFNVISNAVKVRHDTAMAAVRNMK